MVYQFAHQDFKNWYYQQSKDYQGEKLSDYQKGWIENKYKKEIKAVKGFLTSEFIYYYQPGDKYPFIVACEKGYINVVEIMIKFNLPTSKIGLTKASKNNHKKVVKILLNHGFKDFSKLGIFWAYSNVNKEIFNMFLEKEFNLSNHSKIKYFNYFFSLFSNLINTFLVPPIVI
jgi:hypothetical protein